MAIMRSRTQFYAALMRLLNIELDDAPDMLDPFLQPISGKIFNGFSISII